MSFLLSAKPRRRNQLPAGNVTLARGRTFTKDASDTNCSGGQMQIQYSYRSQNRSHLKISPQQEGFVKQRDQQKQDAMQSVGISMEQVMEDLRILEEQQQDSQRKLKQVKTLKHNRLEHRSTVENQLNSLKYKNGEHRAQLNRKHEVLSLATHEMEAVKLDSTRNDERLKALDTKLKKALFVSSIHQAHSRKINGRLLKIRNQEAACYRYLSDQREGLKSFEARLRESVNADRKFREAIEQLNKKSNEVSSEISTIRSTMTRVGEELRLSEQMEASTRLRAGSIADEINAEEQRHSEEKLNIMKRMEETRSQKIVLTSQKEQFSKNLELHNAELHELWKTCVVIQIEEGHKVSREPTGGDPVPIIDVKGILDTVSAHDHKLSVMTATRDKLVEQHDLRKIELRAFETDYRNLARESSELRLTLNQMHSNELDRTRRHDEFLLALENDREQVRKLSSSLEELQIGLRTERERLESEASVHIDEVKKKQTQLDGLRKQSALNHDGLLELRNRSDSDKLEVHKNVESSKASVESAKASFDQVQAEMKKFSHEDDLETDQEVAQIEQVHEIMVEEISAQIARLLRENPKLHQLDHRFDKTKSPESRIRGTLSLLQDDCRKHSEDILLRQKEICAKIRHIRRRKERRSTFSPTRDQGIKERHHCARGKKRRLSGEDRRNAFPENMQAAQSQTGQAVGVTSTAAHDKCLMRETMAKAESPMHCIASSKHFSALSSATALEDHHKDPQFVQKQINGRVSCEHANLTSQEMGDCGMSREKKDCSFLDAFLEEGSDEKDERESCSPCLTQRFGIDFSTTKTTLGVSPLDVRRQKLSVHWKAAHRENSEYVNSDVRTNFDNSAERELSEEVRLQRTKRSAKEKQIGGKIFGSASQRVEKRLQETGPRERSTTVVSRGSVISKQQRSSPVPIHEVDVGENIRYRPLSPASGKETSDIHGRSSSNFLRKNETSFQRNNAFDESAELSAKSRSERSKPQRREKSASQKLSFPFNHSEIIRKKIKAEPSCAFDRPQKRNNRSLSNAQIRCNEGLQVVKDTTPLPTSGSEKVVQASGISSGERGVLRSRRRRGSQALIGSRLLQGKSSLAKVDDFSFNF